ncbi:light-regulated protein-like [Durio zibethinus]|uniref:Light-regulated protein-like n=1 Tax=Durio zibethinus TaxID=66656 RepID=A0A6P5ZI55_DURZI|nr:light-regulated protein-like [Durio zibethinus]
MQAVALSIAPPLLPNFSPSKKLVVSSSPRQGRSIASCSAPLNTKAICTYGSVFPAEACETIGGDACRANIYPEVKLQSEARNDFPRTATELIDREYLEYNDAKTVFCAEACDDLGGEFCGREYQREVY